MLRSLNRILTLAEKEWIQIRRDLRSLLISLFIPAAMIVLFGYALNMDVKNISVGVFDQDKSAFSRSYLERFSHTEYLVIRRHIEKYEDIDRLLDSGEIAMAMIIPLNFQRDYTSGRSVPVQLLVDGSDSTAATISIGYVKAITNQFNADRSMDNLRRAGISSMRMPIDIRTRIWYNPTLESKNFIVPGLIVILLTVISALIASLTISREWERGTMETLITTPVRRIEIIFGKLIPFILIGLFDTIFCIAVGYFIFDAPLKGSFLLFCALAILYFSGTSLMGILISSATRVQVMSIQVAMWVTYLPSMILSGFIFPIKNMPSVLQVMTYIIPARYLISIVNSIALKGVGLAFLWTQVLFLLGFVVLMLMLSIRKMSVSLPEA
ncbi:MAG: ABC transporter permease [Spirochaetes bacterium]|nr:ABC transporter permease [Spirochaetota bacterium]